MLYGFKCFNICLILAYLFSFYADILNTIIRKLNTTCIIISLSIDIKYCSILDIYKIEILLKYIL